MAAPIEDDKNNNNKTHLSFIKEFFPLTAQVASSFKNEREAARPSWGCSCCREPALYALCLPLGRALLQDTSSPGVVWLRAPLPPLSRMFRKSFSEKVSPITLSSIERGGGHVTIFQSLPGPLGGRGGGKHTPRDGGVSGVVSRQAASPKDRCPAPAPQT